MADYDAISFGTDGWRDHREAFTDDRVAAVAQAFADHLASTGHAGGRVAVGYDARPDSSHIAEVIAGTIVGAGHDVLVADRDCPTPAVAAAVDTFDLAGGAMVTASHNPPEYNGIKLIPHGGAPALPEVTDAIERSLRPPDPVPEADRGSSDPFDYVEFHLETIAERVPADLEGLSIVYDAMHGSGRGVTDVALERAGAEVTRLRCSRDPEFGGTPPEPTEEHLPRLVEAVEDGGYDLGVANDGDADRVAIVTPEGYVDANHLFAAMYDHLLEERRGPAVRTVSTTFLIDRIARAHGERVHETAVGFKWVAKAMAEHDALIGGEDSGGFTVRGHVREKDGPLAATVVAGAEAERRIDDRLAAIREDYGEIHHESVSVACPEARKAAVIEAVGTDRPASIAGSAVESVNDADGYKFLLDDGSWILVRPSGTEPVMRVYAEAGSGDRARRLAAAGEEMVSTVLQTL